MSTPGQIRSKAARINTFHNRLRQAKDRCHGYAFNSVSWWQGDGGNKQRSEYDEIEAKINQLLRRVDKLEYYTQELSTNVQQAIKERRRKEQDKPVWA